MHTSTNKHTHAFTIPLRFCQEYTTFWSRTHPNSRTQTNALTNAHEHTRTNERKHGHADAHHPGKFAFCSKPACNLRTHSYTCTRSSNTLHKLLMIYIFYLGNKAGGNCWAKLLNRNYVVGMYISVLCVIYACQRACVCVH